MAWHIELTKAHDPMIDNNRHGYFVGHLARSTRKLEDGIYQVHSTKLA